MKWLGVGGVSCHQKMFVYLSGASINPNTLKAMSDKPESDYYHQILPGQNVLDIVHDILNKICNEV